MSKENKESGVFYITHKGELLVWLVIVLIVVAICSTTYVAKEKNDDDEYHVYMPDVDGLIVGSPVRMMGIEVGHVIKIKPTNQEVYVKFVLTNPDVYIPQGTAVTVEFTGLAGSKSLELYLPRNDRYIDNSTPILTVHPPKRLHDALGMLNDMYKKLTSIIYTSTSFSDKLNKETEPYIKSLNGNDNAKDFLDFSNKFINESNKKEQELNKSIKEFNKNAK